MPAEYTEARKIVFAEMAQAIRQCFMKSSSKRPGGVEDPSTEAPDGAPLAPPCVMVIFGAAGDLTKRLVVPALYNLVGARRLPNEFQIVGVDLASKTTEEWRAGLTETMQGFVGADSEAALDRLDTTAWEWLTARMSYVQGDLNDAQTYKRLDDHLTELEKTAGTSGNRLFYLAIADRFFSVAVDGLGAAGLLAEKDGQWRRVIIEKPFGHDLDSAKALNAEILKHLQGIRFTGSIIFSAKKPCRTLWRSGSPTVSSSRCGIENTSITFRLPLPRLSGWSSVENFMKRPAHCATWSPITYFNYWQ